VLGDVWQWSLGCPSALVTRNPRLSSMCGVIGTVLIALSRQTTAGRPRCRLVPHARQRGAGVRRVSGFSRRAELACWEPPTYRYVDVGGMAGLVYDGRTRAITASCSGPSIQLAAWSFSSGKSATRPTARSDSAKQKLAPEKSGAFFWCVNAASRVQKFHSTYRRVSRQCVLP
jgi:hypothetical protein